MFVVGLVGATQSTADDTAAVAAGELGPAAGSRGKRFEAAAIARKLGGTNAIGMNFDGRKQLAYYLIPYLVAGARLGMCWREASAVPTGLATTVRAFHAPVAGVAGVRGCAQRAPALLELGMDPRASPVCRELKRLWRRKPYSNVLRGTMFLVSVQIVRTLLR